MTEISSLAALTGANVASTDLFLAVDTSDTSMAATGTDKKITAANLSLTTSGVVNVQHYGLIDDGVTDNHAALVALIALYPQYACATFVWPAAHSPSQYLFKSAVEWGERSIHNIGVGFSGANNFPLDAPAITCGANSMTAFTVTGGSGGMRSLFQAGPSFENLWFGNDGTHLTSIVGLSLSAANRVHLHNVGFEGLTTGVVLNENGQDCAWHDWQNVTFLSCATPVLSTASNSWRWHGGYIGTSGPFDVVAMNSVQITGLKVNGPTSIGLRLGSAGAGSSGAGCYDNIIQTIVEMDNAAGPRTACQINGNTGNFTAGCGNKVMLGLHGGGVASNVGLDLTSGSHHNSYEIPYQIAFADDAHTVQDAGTRNVPVTVFGIIATPQYGNGPPGGSTYGLKGQLYINRTATTTTTRMYINTDGATTWTNFTTAA